MSEKPIIDRIGISRVETFFSSHGWLFREQHQNDFGIDAQVEIVEGRKPTGALIGIQVKSGTSYFKEETEAAYVFRTDNRHIEYWSNHMLPIIIILFHPDRNELFWERVEAETSTCTGNLWKIEIPKENQLNEHSLQALRQLLQPPPYIQKLMRLKLDRKWINLVATGEVVYIEFEDWINKSLPRFQIIIGCDSKSDVESEIWPTTYAPETSIKEIIGHLLPWADYEMDLEAHEEYMRNVWYDECFTWYDKETNTPFFTIPFEEWYSPPGELSPCYENGEVEKYRLLLSLNDLGKSFLNLDNFLIENDPILKKVFTLE